MKKLAKYIMLVFTLVMAFTFVGADEAQAANKITLFAGEQLQYTPDYYTVKSVKSSNKKVATVKKYRGYSSIITAKKKGTATITVKTKRKSYKFKVTVVKPKVKVTVESVSQKYLDSLGYYSGTIIYSVKNNSKLPIDTLPVKYTIKDTAGNTVQSDYKSVYYVGKGKTAYFEVYFNNSTKPVSPAKSSGKFGGVTYRSFSRSYGNGYKYTDTTKKASVSVSKNSKYAYGLQLNIKAKNKYKYSSDIMVSVLGYDSTGRLIEVGEKMFSLRSGTTDSSSYTFSSREVTSYKIKTRAYSYNRIY